jgi:plastocyanin
MSATWRRDPGGRRRRALIAAAAALVLLAAGCGATGSPDTTVQEIVVPLGTMEKLERGEDVAVMPTELRFEVGDTLRIRNEDLVAQAVGPYRVAAGDEFEVTFGSPGRFEGVCPLAEGERYEIVITE